MLVCLLPDRPVSAGLEWACCYFCCLPFPGLGEQGCGKVEGQSQSEREDEGNKEELCVAGVACCQLAQCWCVSLRVVVVVVLPKLHVAVRSWTNASIWALRRQQSSGVG